MNLFIFIFISSSPFQNPAFSIMNMLLPSSSCATMTLTTCRILIHYDNIDSIFLSNLVQLPRLWISSSPLGMSLPHPSPTSTMTAWTDTRQAVGATFCLIILVHHFHRLVLISFTLSSVPPSSFILFIVPLSNRDSLAGSIPQVASIFPILSGLDMNFRQVHGFTICNGDTSRT